MNNYDIFSICVLSGSGGANIHLWLLEIFSVWLHVATDKKNCSPSLDSALVSKMSTVCGP